MKITDIDYYSEFGESRLNRLSARIKLLAAFFVIMLVVFSRNIYVLAGLYLVLTGITFCSKVPKYKIFKISLFPLIFLVLFFLSIHNLSVELLFIFLFKALSASTALVLLVFITSYIDIFRNISRFMPDFIINILFLTYRSLFILAKTLENLLDMLKFRGMPSLKKPVLWGKTLGKLIGHFILKSIQTGENMYDAMVLRGYSGNFDYLNKSKR